MSSIRGYLVFAFLLLYTIAMVRPIFPVLEYQFFKESIIENKCVNTNKPELKCEGKCYFRAQLVSYMEGNSSSEEQSETLPNIEIEKFPYAINFEETFQLHFPITTLQHHFIYNRSYQNWYGDVIVPPPVNIFLFG